MPLSSFFPALRPSPGFFSFHKIDLKLGRRPASLMGKKFCLVSCHVFSFEKNPRVFGRPFSPKHFPFPPSCAPPPNPLSSPSTTPTCPVCCTLLFLRFFSFFLHQHHSTSPFPLRRFSFSLELFFSLFGEAGTRSVPCAPPSRFFPLFYPLKRDTVAHGSFSFAGTCFR